MHRQTDVIIVGSGMAGLAAADLLAGNGLSVLVIDDNAFPGGQLLRHRPHAHAYKGFEPDRLKRQGYRLIRKLRPGSVRFLHGTQVLGIFPGRTLLAADSRGRSSEHRAESLILATGARERQLPFNGWTLPGVMSAGAAQILMKSAGILPGVRTLIGGCGPLILVLAAEIAAHGGTLQGLLDQTRAITKLAAVTAGPAIWPKLLEGAVHLSRLIAARVPIQQGVRIVEARGRRHLEKVVAARTDTEGRIVTGSEWIVPTDTLAIGYGFCPNIELPLQAGCAVSHDIDKGGWIVDVDAAMATSVSGTYAAGEVTGIAGAGKSVVEGQLAAWDILYRCGAVDRRHYKQHMRTLHRQRRRQIRYGRFLNQWCRMDPGAYTDIPDETIICRCEEVTMGTIRRQLSNGLTTLEAIKKATRCQMGPCQGRMCAPILTDIIGAHTGQTPQQAGCPSARAPVKTVSLGALAKMETADGRCHENSERQQKLAKTDGLNEPSTT